MRALTLIQPWASAVAYAGKRIENRSWKPPAGMLGQRIAIHAGKSYERLARLVLGRAATDTDPVHSRKLSPEECPLGAVVAVATLAGYGMLSPPGENWTPRWGLPPRSTDLVWYVPGHWGWVLHDVVALREPVPCRGMQGLWTLPQHVERAVLLDIEGQKADRP